MRAAVIAEDRTIAVTDVDEPDLLSGQVRVRISRCGICGSDLHMREMTARFPSGCIIGHEIVGTISDLGDTAAGWAVGDRVAMYHSVSCGNCDNCLAGHDYMCRHASTLSLGLGVVPGGYAETIAAPLATLFAVDTHVSDEAATLAEPFAIALHGLNKAAIAPDTATVVLGAGPIGAMTAVALQLRGHDNIVVVDPNVNRQALVRELGIRAVGLDDVESAVNAALGGAPRAVLECSGGARAAALAVDLVHYRGRVMLQGMPSKRVELSQATILVKEVELVGAVSCTTAEFTEALDLLAAGAIPSSALITGTIGLDQVNRAFDDLLSPGNDQLKVLVAPAG